jgi:hypothetical protein
MSSDRRHSGPKAEPNSIIAPPYRRAIRITRHDGVIRAGLEDDYHRFGVVLTHDGDTILTVEGSADRFPWLTCAEAPGALTALVGAKLSRDPTALFRLIDPRLQCTHLFELAALALAEGARGDGETLFEAEVSDPLDGRRVARVFRDGSLAVKWRLRDDVIVAPAPYAGRTLAQFNSRAISLLEPGLASCLLIMRRVVGTAMSRRLDVDSFKSAAELGHPGNCYSLQAANAARALRMLGSVRVWPDRETLAANIRP